MKDELKNICSFCYQSLAIEIFVWDMFILNKLLCKQSQPHAFTSSLLVLTLPSSAERNSIQLAHQRVKIFAEEWRPRPRENRNSLPSDRVSDPAVTFPAVFSASSSFLTHLSARLKETACSFNTHFFTQTSRHFCKSGAGHVCVRAKCFCVLGCCERAPSTRGITTVCVCARQPDDLVPHSRSLAWRSQAPAAAAD